MLFFGYKMSKAKSQKQYWQYAVFPILTYCVSMGMRFGRMIDYNLYADRYYELGRNFNAYDYEFLFKGLCYVLNSLGLSYQFFILLCSFLIIYAVIFFIKDYRKATPYILLLFLWEGITVENYIRWFLGISFFLFFITFLKRGEFKKSTLFAIIAFLFHSGIFPLIGICLILYKLKIKYNPIIVQILLVVSIFLGSIQILNFLTPYMSFLSINDKAAGYTDSFEQIVNGEFGYVGYRASKELITQLRILVAYSFPIYIIPKLVEKLKISDFDSNVFIVAIIATPLLTQVEILDRYSTALLILSIVASGSAYYYSIARFKTLSIFFRCFCVLSLIAYVYPVLSGIFQRTEWYKMLFIWDANGREALPLMYFF